MERRALIFDYNIEEKICQIILWMYSVNMKTGYVLYLFTVNTKKGKKKFMKNKKHIVTGILAHVDAGKTTLSEAILYTAGNLRKIGRVDNGDAFLDTYELERSRGITIFSKQAEVSMNEMDLTLLDTPGHVDFSAEMERTYRCLIMRFL